MIFELALLVIIVFLALWIGGSYLVVRNIEKPTYTIFRSHRSYEIRQYDPYIIAYVDVSGDFNQSQNNGFRILANYIFGGNIKKEKIEMTAPVIQKPLKEDSIKIKMTAPVIQDKIGETYRISFVMPSKFTMETLPDPIDPSVKFMTMQSRQVAVYTFKGYAAEKRVKNLETKFLVMLKEDGYDIKGGIKLCQYNPPFTPPFLRLNELHADLE